MSIRLINKGAWWELLQEEYVLEIIKCIPIGEYINVIYVRKTFTGDGDVQLPYWWYSV